MVKVFQDDVRVHVQILIHDNHQTKVSCVADQPDESEEESGRGERNQLQQFAFAVVDMVTGSRNIAEVNVDVLAGITDDLFSQVEGEVKIHEI